MRIAPDLLAAVALVALASCGDHQRAGLYVQLTGGHAGTAASVEVIAAAPAVMIQQRTSDAIGSDTTDVAVPYYVQRATTGEIVDAIDLSSYTVLVEDPLVDLRSVVPIVVARDANHTVTAIGVLEDDTSADGAPPANAIQVDPSEAEIVQVTMLGVAVTPSAAPVAGELDVLRCAQPVAVSGFDWYDRNARELRIVLPGNGSSATDAKDRGLDLDCDLSPAPDDCDDLRADIHPGQAVGCNGLDNNCAMTPATRVDACDEGPGCPDAVQTCDEAGSGTLSACVSDMCDVPFDDCTAFASSSGGSGLTICDPTIGQIQLPTSCANGCDLEVVGATNGVVAGLSLDPTGTFTDEVTVGTNGVVWMSVMAPNGVDSSGELGIVGLSVLGTSGLPSSAYYVNVGATTSGDQDCTGSNGTTDTGSMICIPHAVPGTPQN